MKNKRGPEELEAEREELEADAAAQVLDALLANAYDDVLRLQRGYISIAALRGLLLRSREGRQFLKPG